MLMFAVGAIALVLGYVFYSRVLQRILSPLRTTTPRIFAEPVKEQYGAD